MKPVVAVLRLFATLTVPATAFAKGEMVRIDITGAALAAPLEITAPEVIDHFSVWTGPGVRVNGQPVHQEPSMQSGAIVDWPRGAVAAPPSGLHHRPWHRGAVVLPVGGVAARCRAARSEGLSARGWTLEPAAT